MGTKARVTGGKGREGRREREGTRTDPKGGKGGRREKGLESTNKETGIKGKGGRGGGGGVSRCGPGRDVERGGTPPKRKGGGLARRVLSLGSGGTEAARAHSDERLWGAPSEGKKKKGEKKMGRGGRGREGDRSQSLGGEKHKQKKLLPRRARARGNTCRCSPVVLVRGGGDARRRMVHAWWGRPRSSLGGFPAVSLVSFIPW